MMALIETDEFEAGIDIAGIANLHTMMERTQGYLKKMLSRKLGGTPEERPDLYDERSPVLRADEITDPLQVIQGANDPRVPPKEAEQIVAELEERNVPHNYLLFEDEGHAVESSQNRVELLQEMDAFLTEHMGESSE